MTIGRIGCWQAEFITEPAADVRAAAVELEELGYDTLWYPEPLIAKDCFAAAAIVLAATERVNVATGIANLWARDAMTMATGERTLAEAFPGRFVLGLGVSHAEQVAEHGFDYSKPVSTMRDYLDRMDATPSIAASPEIPATRLLAALRPKMLELSRDRASGAHPYLVPVEHTRRARDILGAGKLLATEVTVVLDADPTAARRIARAFTPFYLSKANYTRNLAWLGYGEDDLEGGGSDRLIDDLVAWGDVDAVTARVAEHLDAGADHVCIQVLTESAGFPLAELRALAPSLVSL